ncbi:hypothetical protein [Streptomyces sp. NPDC093149]|uniref:hypothetical protein n=1 Tax=Streptomyces sp. NPDC093149 TaxID=3366031 RepID=UPI0038205CC2
MSRPEADGAVAAGAEQVLDAEPAARERSGIAPGQAVVGPLISVSDGTPRAR